MIDTQECPPKTQRALPWARPYRRCQRCVMDTTDWEIAFDEHGICNHCRQYRARLDHATSAYRHGWDALCRVADAIKLRQRGRDYDCIVGVSGGADSTMVAYLAKKLGLRALGVHLDNGWDSELAVHNIQKTLLALEFDLETRVLNWPEFRELQKAFLRASVPNSEIPTDHAIFAVLYKYAVELKIPYVLMGANLATEGLMARSWCYDAKDWLHIKAINARFGTAIPRQYPHFSVSEFLYYIATGKLRIIRPLNYVAYRKAEAVELLRKDLDWEPYGSKHCESIYTRFFQSYLLPKKFDIDKRRAHFSTLIMSGQMGRQEALHELERPAFDYAEADSDLQYVLKKFGFEAEDWRRLMDATPRRHEEFPCNLLLSRRMSRMHNAAKRLATRSES